MKTPPFPKPTAEHLWLKGHVGVWTVESGSFTGEERAYMLGDVWLVIDGLGETEQGPHRYQYTLGFDDTKAHFVGSFVSSIMTNLWIYENGQFEDDAIVLECDGPRMDGVEGLARYRDRIELEGDTRTVIGSMLGPDGEWTEFMRALARRTS